MAPSPDSSSTVEAYHPRVRKDTVRKGRGEGEDAADDLVRADLCEERHRHIEERCDNHAQLIEELRAHQARIDGKITATLVFTIVTLVGIIVAIAVGVLK